MDEACSAMYCKTFTHAFFSDSACDVRGVHCYAYVSVVAMTDIVQRHILEAFR